MAPPAQLLARRLTGSELAAPRFFDRGGSNQEIAAELYISLGTVKRHISNIYTKLEAGGRTQALARSRDLRLLD